MNIRFLHIDESELFSNLALLLSDQCTHSIKIAVFGDDAKTAFKDQKELAGSIFTQLEDAFHYLMLCNKTAAAFKGLERIESPDYPEEALREALLDAIVHRDYSFSGSIIINVNDREMEFISISGLLPGLSPDDIRAGISQPWIEVTSNTFKMVLPNMNTARADQQPHSESFPIITAQMRKILDYIREHGQITDEEIQSLLDLKKTRAYTLAKRMRELRLIAAEGRGKEKVYQRIEDIEMKIGVLSDTHDLLRPEAEEALRGCDQILHGGDVSSPQILARLSQIAPMQAVRGNNDREWAQELPLTFEGEKSRLSW